MGPVVGRLLVGNAPQVLERERHQIRTLCFTGEPGALAWTRMSMQRERANDHHGPDCQECRPLVVDLGSPTRLT